jgi:hypothetical protein
MILPFQRSWFRSPWFVAGLVAVAALSWCDAIQQMRETQARIRFSEQLKSNLDQLQRATDAIAKKR